ncbi:hypothetical protein HKD37_11G032117 [Glycine soja]
MHSYPARALDRRLQEDWARDARQGPRVLMSLRVDFGCRNLPFCGRARRGSRVRFPKGGKCTESPLTFICGKRRKNRRKPVIKNIPDSRVVFTFEEGRQKWGSCSYVPSIEEEIRPT